MKVYCDSSVTEACIVFPNDEIHLITYSARVTTNQGEYLALLNALELLADPLYKFDVKILSSDSQLIVNQVSGLWRCRDSKLIPLRDSARVFVERLKVRLLWVPREQNLAGIVLELRKKDEHRKKS